MTTTSHSYTLELSEFELTRHRDMAAKAREFEEAAWLLAGIVPGAQVADVGCGPGIVLAELARLVAPGGSVTGIDPSAEARAITASLIEAEGISNADVREGRAERTGLEAGAFDVVMQRHVLLHNGGREQTIVSHLASLLCCGGALYLVETDLDGVRFGHDDPDISDLWDRWRELMRRLGNDESVGAHLEDFVRGAGLHVTDIDARFDIVELTVDQRPPSWAARQALVDAGLATDDDVARWDDALGRAASAEDPMVAYVPLFRVVARRGPVAAVPALPRLDRSSTAS